MIALPTRPFTWREAQAAGLTQHVIAELITSRRIWRVVQGVYRPDSLPDTVESRCQAVRLVLPPFGVVCDRTAAWLHGVDTFEFRELQILPPVEVVVLRHNTRMRRKGCRGRERDLAPRDVCFLDGVRVTTPVRTALDLGCALGLRDALAVLDGFMRICGVTREQLDAELPRFRRRRGVVQLRRLIPLASPLAESPGESWTRMAIAEFGLPDPEIQYWVVVDGVRVYRLDLAYPKIKVAVEYDGQGFHSTPAQVEADEARRDWLRALGWTVIVVKRTSFGHCELDAWIGELTRALHRS